MMRPLTLAQRAMEKRELIKALQLRATEIREAVGPRAYAPSSGRNVEVHRFDDAMNERKKAEELGFSNSVLRMGRTRWTLFASPSAHNNLAHALSKLHARRFEYWTLEYDL